MSFPNGEEIMETTDSLDKAKDSLANIQRNIAIIQEQKEQVKDIWEKYES